VEGTTQIPPGTTVTSTTDSAPLSIQPSSPLVGGELRILLTTNQVLHAGLNIPVTFQFRNAGKVTLPVPMGALSDAGARSPAALTRPTPSELAFELHAACCLSCDLRRV
jgi:hypothetical protein